MKVDNFNRLAQSWSLKVLTPHAQGVSRKLNDEEGRSEAISKSIHTPISEELAKQDRLLHH